MPERQRNKILIIGENPCNQGMIENALKSIFKKHPKTYIKVNNSGDALLGLCANQDNLCCIFCYHSNQINGVQLFRDWQNLARVKSIPFALLMDIRFVSIVEEAERMGIICVQFPVYPISSLDLAKIIVRAMTDKAKKR